MDLTSNATGKQAVLAKNPVQFESVSISHLIFWISMVHPQVVKVSVASVSLAVSFYPKTFVPNQKLITMFKVFSRDAPPSFEEHLIHRAGSRSECRVIDEDGDKILQLHCGKYIPEYIQELEVMRWTAKSDVVARYIHLYNDFRVGDEAGPPAWINEFDTALTHLFRFMHAPDQHKDAAFDTFIGAQTPRSWYALAKVLKQVGRPELLARVGEGLEEWFFDLYLSLYDNFDKETLLDYPDRKKYGRAEELLRLGAAARMLKQTRVADDASRRLQNFFVYEEVTVDDECLPGDASFDQWTDKWTHSKDTARFSERSYCVDGTANHVPPRLMDMEIGQFSSESLKYSFKLSREYILNASA
jgi:hypothetical protein